MHFWTGKSDISTPFLRMEPWMELMVGGLGAGQGVLGVSRSRAGALLILEARAASLGVLY